MRVSSKELGLEGLKCHPRTLSVTGGADRGHLEQIEQIEAEAEQIEAEAEQIKAEAEQIVAEMVTGGADRGHLEQIE